MKQSKKKRLIADCVMERDIYPYLKKKESDVLEEVSKLDIFRAVNCPETKNVRRIDDCFFCKYKLSIYSDHQIWCDYEEPKGEPDGSIQ